MTTNTLSFRGDAALKAEHVAQAEHHAAADMLMSGTYGEGSGANFRGCSVGCFAHEINPDEYGNWHETVAEARGLPEWLIRLQDSIFEGLGQDERAQFHVELAKRIPVGVDLEPVKHRIAVARIDRALATQRVALEAKHPHGVHEAVEQTIAALEVGRRAHEAAAGGQSCDLWSARSAAESAARSAAWSAESAAWSAESAESAESAASAAWSAARSAARSAAWSAESAAWSAESAAWSAASAAWSAARSAARSAAWIAERDALFAALDQVGV
ncbi:hypothetical protein [Lysobacter enzymogenes]|uniref:hypothetical protein n=2 Tax=Lysobacter enzymogenes TaxID=69 RepID=UPI0008966742|nr:hypothetical protein [Lysobacter enzymogenes]SDW93886.1 hypothetical protein SAMN05421681_103280 [Lysobacter enzymogenes]